MLSDQYDAEVASAGYGTKSEPVSHEDSPWQNILEANGKVRVSDDKTGERQKQVCVCGHEHERTKLYNTILAENLNVCEDNIMPKMTYDTIDVENRYRDYVARLATDSLYMWDYYSSDTSSFGTRFNGIMSYLCGNESYGNPIDKFTSLGNCLSASNRHGTVGGGVQPKAKNLPEMVSRQISGIGFDSGYSDSEIGKQMEAMQYANYLKYRITPTTSVVGRELFRDVSIDTEYNNLRTQLNNLGISVGSNSDTDIKDNIDNIINILTGIVMNGMADANIEARYDIIQILTDFSELQSIVDNAKVIGKTSWIDKYLTMADKLKTDTISPKRGQIQQENGQYV